MGEIGGCIQEEIFFFKTHIDSVIAQYEDDGIRANNLTHQHIYSSVAELSSQGLNFGEEIKALALLSSLPASWEVFYTIVTNISMKVTLNEAIKQVLSEDLQ